MWVRAGLRRRGPRGGLRWGCFVSAAQRTEKLTRLPMRFPRTRPLLPLRRSLMDLTGLPERIVARGWPATVLSK